MRKNKGYQKDKCTLGWRRGNLENSFASGKNKSFEQYLKDIDDKFDKRIEVTKKSYAKISRKTTLFGEDLRKYCNDCMLWEVEFDDNGKLIPLEDVIKKLEERRERCKKRDSYRYVKRITNKDNQKFVYNTGSRNSGKTVRVPSMKRSNAVWKRFYELFPYYKKYFNDLNNKNGLKLKKVW